VNEDTASLITLLLYTGSWFTLGLLAGYLIGWTCRARRSHRGKV
jgi:hypothetical protein